MTNPRLPAVSLLIHLVSVFLLAAVRLAPASGPALSIDGLEGSNVDQWKVRGDGVIEFTVRRDSSTRHVWRWFYFRVENPGAETLTFEIPDARAASASSGWRFGLPMASTDGGKTWHRTAEASYRHGVYRFQVEPAEGRSLLVALAPPYHYARYLGLVDRISGHPRVASSRVLTHSLRNRPVHHLVIREPGQGPLPAVWVIARQHPAETAGSWKMEGLIEWLLSDDPATAVLLGKMEFHLVPFMNPDGVVMGNYRRNAAGLNLNREWNSGANKNAPTVEAVKDLMRKQHKEGREFIGFFDLHAISSQAKNFMYYTEDLLVREEYDRQLDQFLTTFGQLNPLFTKAGSESTYPGKEGIAKDWAHSEFFIPSYTFESSYQHVDYGPSRGKYLAIEDYKELGRDLGRTILRIYAPSPTTSAVGE